MSRKKVASPKSLPKHALNVAEEISAICRQAWERGLLAGFNGNVSCLLPEPFEGKECFLITRSGAAKSSLTDLDFALVSLENGANGTNGVQALAGGKPSSETRMHIEIYNHCPKARAIVHTHPPHMLALSLLMPFEERLKLPMFEADAYRKNLAQAPDHEPGTLDLARAVAEEAKNFQAVWMEKHGLAAHGPDLTFALGLTEELEQLAKIQILAMQAGGLKKKKQAKA